MSESYFLCDSTPEYQDEIIAMMMDFHEEMIPFGKGTFDIWEREKFEKRFPLPEWHVLFLVRSGEQTVGYLWLEIREESEGYVQAFYLRPGFRGQGLGKHMLRHAEMYFRDQGCTHIVLSALADNTNANRFYTKNGFLLTSYKYRKDL